MITLHTKGRQEPSKTWAQQVDDLATKIRQWTGNDAGILDISTVDLDRIQVNEEAILDSWQRDGILLWGQKLPQPQIAPR